MFGQKVWAWAPPVAWALLIVTMSSIPSSRLGPSQLWDYDKLVHAVVFGTLSGLLMRGFVIDSNRLRWALWFIISVGLASAFGITDEWHQSFTPGRDASSADVVADVAGAVLGAGLVRVLYRRRAGAAAAGTSQ